MTIAPLPPGTGPFYERLADHMAGLINTGALAPGTRLPPQRDLATELGTTVGTVGRAYKLLHQRGLATGEVGRGTYILSGESPPAPLPAQGEPAAPDAVALLSVIADHLAAIRRTLDAVCAKMDTANSAQDGSS